MFSDVFTALKDGMQCIVFKVRDTFRPKMIAIKVFERKTLINLNIFEVFFKSCNSLKGNINIKRSINLKTTDTFFTFCNLEK